MEEIQLSKHGRHTVALPSHGTAGYQWNFSVDNPQLLQIERLLYTSTHPPPTQEQLRAERFTLIAQREAGQTTVHFHQTRSFEPNKPPLATQDFRVVIT